MEKATLPFSYKMHTAVSQRVGMLGMCGYSLCGSGWKGSYWSSTKWRCYIPHSETPGLSTYCFFVCASTLSYAVSHVLHSEGKVFLHGQYTSGGFQLCPP